jgi:hypothetical protein
MAAGIQDLEWFTRESLLKGLGKPEIRTAMLDAGWTEDQVRTALDAYSEVTFPVPIPRPRPQLSARDASLYLVLFTTLYFSSYNLGSLLFDFINKAFPDPTVQIHQMGWDSMRWSAAALIVASGRQRPPVNLETPWAEVGQFAMVWKSLSKIC